MRMNTARRLATPGAARVTTAPTLVETLDTLSEAAADFARAAKSPATLRAYQTDLLRFRQWCVQHGVAALPAEPQTVALYATALMNEGKKVATIRRKMVAIGVEHKQHGLANPAKHEIVQDVFKGIRRAQGVRQTKKTPLWGREIRAIIEALPETRRGWRDRAILLLGLASGLRRSELVSVQVEWLTFTPEGLDLFLSRSKTDQEGHGRMIHIDPGEVPITCPVATLQQYFRSAGIAAGPLFREIDRHGNVGEKALSGESVALIVQRHVREILGKDASAYGGHSLRAGFASELYEHGVDLLEIKRAGGWKSQAVEEYIRGRRRKSLKGKLGI